MAVKSGKYAVFEAIQFEMHKDPHLTLFYENEHPVAVSAMGNVIDLYTQFGKDRVPDTAIDEEWYVGAGTGVAMTGVRAIAHIPRMTIVRAFELVFNQVGKLRYMTGGQVNLPLVIWIDGAGRQANAAAQHADAGQEALYAGIAGVKVVVPSNPYDAKGLMTAALRDPDPVVFYHYSAIDPVRVDVPDGDYVVPIGEAIVRQQGTHLTIVGFGPSAMEINKAIPGLKAAGISAEIIDPRTLKPLPVTAIADSVRKTGKLLVVDHGQYTMGTAAEIIASVATAVPGAKMARITFPDAPSPGAAEMIRWMTPQASNIVDAAKVLVA